ncbi:MAG: radical SAM protein [Rhodobacter sp.]|nr:radical SAM protein [Rhodobacter sp.]
MTKQSFHVVMIKPTHYDPDGYPIQWMRSVMPSNTLAAINALLDDCIQRGVLGGDVEIRPQAIDETNTRVRPDRIIRKIRRDGGRAFVMFVGVQTNQFPRAVDLAQPFLKAGLPVAFGGFHVSGCKAMLDEEPAEIVEAKAMGISLFAGELEEQRLDEVLRDAYAGTLKPEYDYLNALPSLEGQPTPFLDVSTIGKTIANYTSFDLGRGCPYQCSFCTIINVQGRKSRFRTPDDLEAIIRANFAQGVHKFFITDDDLARNKNWEALFDRLIHMREVEGHTIRLTVQVDMACHKIPGFIDKACRAGVERVFMGLENINPDNLVAANKRQNKITDYRAMIQQWRKHGATIIAGYILGFPNDTPESIKRDIAIIQEELPIDILHFSVLTPLPGSADHKKLLAEGVWMDPDHNKYDVCQRVTHHETMSDADWDQAFHDAWFTYYTPEHMERICRRSAAQEKKGVNLNEVLEVFLAYKLDGVHPMEGGFLRRKHRRDRRPGLPRENPLRFYPRYWVRTVRNLTRLGWGVWQANRLQERIFSHPDRRAYIDLATTPPDLEEHERLALFQNTSGGRDAVRRERVIGRAREKAVAGSDVPAV